MPCYACWRCVCIYIYIYIYIYNWICSPWLVKQTSGALSWATARWGWWSAGGRKTLPLAAQMGGWGRANGGLTSKLVALWISIRTSFFTPSRLQVKIISSNSSSWLLLLPHWFIWICWGPASTFGLYALELNGFIFPVFAFSNVQLQHDCWKPEEIQRLPNRNQPKESVWTWHLPTMSTCAANRDSISTVSMLASSHWADVLVHFVSRHFCQGYLGLMDVHIQ